MTFYEAALRVLEEAGMPLLSTDITKRAVEKGLLSHIGKTPEITMLSRLAAMAKRPRDRKLQVTAKDTFALIDWMLPEDPEALAATGIIEPNPEEALPPYRPSERHPEAHAEFLRSIGRQGDRKRRDDDRKKKFPPIAEVAFEVLQEAATALPPGELLARIKAREGVSDDCSISQLIDGLALDNQKRVDESRKPAFAAARTEANELQLSVEPQAEGGPTALEVQTAFCAACNLPFENGRVVLKSERRAQQAAAAAAAAAEAPTGVAAPAGDDVALIATARHAGKDARKAMARVLRKKLADLDLGTFEKACVRMLHGLHFRELKVARRSKDGPLLTARRREGSLEIRYAVRVLKGGGQVERRLVQELRRELQQTGANVGLLLTAGEARGDARSECTTGALVMMWAGDALADKFFEAKVGVSVTTIELYDIDEAFFAQAKLDADEATKRREDRQRERDQRGPDAGDKGESDEVPVARASAPAVEASVAVTMPEGVPAVQAEGADEEDDGEEGDEGEEGAEGGSDAAPGTPGDAGEGKRRRRRRRRRRRGGARPDGTPGEAGQVAGAPAAPGDVSAAPASASAPVPSEAPAAPAPAPEPEPAEPSAPPTPSTEPT